MSELHEADAGTERLEDELRAAAEPAPAAWDRARSQLGARATTEGLVDVAFERHDSPLGRLLLGATDAGLVRVGLPTEDEDEVLDEMARRISPRVLFGPRTALSTARRELDEYFEGRRREFEVPLDWRLTAGFRLKVLHATARIPYGRTLSYKQVAAEAGNPAASRAAGTALATNPIPIVVPCHRVLRADGVVGNYRGGRDAKIRLLALECDRWAESPPSDSNR